jgi:hypothetical protein
VNKPKLFAAFEFYRSNKTCTEEQPIMLLFEESCPQCIAEFYTICPTYPLCQARDKSVRRPKTSISCRCSCSSSLHVNNVRVNHENGTMSGVSGGVTLNRTQLYRDGGHSLASVMHKYGVGQKPHFPWWTVLLLWTLVGNSELGSPPLLLLLNPKP